jgi:prophage antirepressor-like protein
MSNLVLLKRESFGSLMCDFYKNKKDEILMTREQIGSALEYDNPQKAISTIHERHKHRLDNFSTTLKVRTVDNKNREVVLYNSKGLYEICRWSRQPKADAFIDWAWDVIDNIRKVLMQKQTQEWQETRSFSKASNSELMDAVKLFVEHAISQGSNYKNYYNSIPKLVNTVVGIENGKRDYSESRTLQVQTFAMDLIKRTILEEIPKGTFYKEIYQICKKKVLELIGYISPKLLTT